MIGTIRTMGVAAAVYGAGSMTGGHVARRWPGWSGGATECLAHRETHSPDNGAMPAR